MGNTETEEVNRITDQDVFTLDTGDNSSDNPSSHEPSDDDGSLERGNNDLRAATSQNDRIVLELSLNGDVMFLSKSWEDIVG